METRGGREWFYRLGDEVIGPITWTELRRLVHSGKVSNQHEVRICRDAHAGQWRPIAAISHLLPELTEQISSAKPAARQEQHAQSAGTCTLEAPPQPPQSVLQVPIARGFATPRPQSIPQTSATVSCATASSTSSREYWSLDPLVDTLIGARLAFMESLQGVGRLARRLAIPLAFVMIWASANAVYWAYASMETEQMQFEKVDQIGKRYFELRESPPDKQAWGNFVVESKTTLQPLIVSLKKHASADRPIQQHLLWASRDCMLVMLDRPWGDAETQEKSFTTHMREVRNKVRQAQGFYH